VARIFRRIVIAAAVLTALLVVAAGDPGAFDRDECPLPERYVFQGEERSPADLLRASETIAASVAGTAP